MNMDTLLQRQQGLHRQRLQQKSLRVNLKPVRVKAMLMTGYYVSFNITLQLSTAKSPRTIVYRNIKDINIDSLTAWLTTLTPDIDSTPDYLVFQYNSGLTSILNTLAPVKSRSVLFTRSAPWFTPHLRSLKSQTRQLERLYRKTGLTAHKDIYAAQLSLYKDSISQAKSHYYSGLICSNAGNTKTLFSLWNRITQPPDSLPPHFYSRDTCNALLLFFNEKINRIHQHLGSSVPFPSSDPLTPCKLFSSFELPQLSLISDLIIKSKTSSCQLDPLPTVLVKSCLHSLLPFISAIIHSSLSTGIVPVLFKTAAVTPILKKNWFTSQ
ncbi:uncharacterized protein LOC127608524 [Hippocampus zosterae]|uniref:uncharacterized protein LOC127608524 n=1 Tax=Hippocampus zosterae TaxID=109293 RepID=UPI00223D12E3|nr:uncharacterized protein LOC127608524 [Hippocampus zosterae]